MIRSILNSNLHSIIVKRELISLSQSISYRCFATNIKENDSSILDSKVSETSVKENSSSESAKTKNTINNIELSKDFTMKLSDINSVSYYSDDFMKQYYPQGYNHDNQTEHNLTGVNSLFLRQPIYDIMNKMNLYTNGYQGCLPSFACITGPRGVGKTTALDSVYLYSKFNNWISWKINARDITHNDVYILPMSRREGNFFAQPELSCTLLSNLYNDNKDKLKNIPLRDTYEEKYFWEKSKLAAMIKDKSITKMNLADLVEYGINNNRDSYEVIMHVRRELAKTIEYPVCICIDEYNYLHDITTFAYNNIKVHASNLYLGHIFRSFNEALVPAKSPIIPQLSNGITLGATTEKHVPTYDFNELVNLKYHQYSLSNMNFDEFTIYIKHLVKTKAFFRNGVHPQELQYLYAMTNGNYEQILNLCKSDTTFTTSQAPGKKLLDYIERNNKQKEFSMWLDENKYIPIAIDTNTKVSTSTSSTNTSETNTLNSENNLESTESINKDKKKAKEELLSEKEKEKRNQKIIEQKKKEYRKMKNKK